MDQMMLFGGAAILIGGILSAGAAALNVPAFFEHPKAQPIVNSLGRVGARIFYGGLGALFMLIGLAMVYRGLQLVGALGGG